MRRARLHFPLQLARSLGMRAIFLRKRQSLESCRLMVKSRFADWLSGSIAQGHFRYFCRYHRYGTCETGSYTSPVRLNYFLYLLLEIWRLFERWFLANWRARDWLRCFQLGASISKSPATPQTSTIRDQSDQRNSQCRKSLQEQWDGWQGRASHQPVHN